MRKEFVQTAGKISSYIDKVFVPEDDLLLSIRANAKAQGLPDIHVAPMDGLHLEVLAGVSKSKKAVEIGTLAGYSGIRILRGMGAGGILHTFELDKKHAEVAAAHFQQAGFSETTKIWLGPALENLQKIEADGPFDFIFIDADKANYCNYFGWTIKNLRTGGVLLADNCFAFGMIADDEFLHPNNRHVVEDLRRFNLSVAHHPKFRATMIPTGEGLLLAKKMKD